jgi:hypothetical protein
MKPSLIDRASEELCNQQKYDPAKKYLMNPNTGSIDTEENWLSENSKKVCENLIEVKFSDFHDAWVNDFIY